jgi:small subunit ribosomal protein S6
VLKYVGGSDLVAEVERNLRLTDVVIKHQTVLLTTDVDMAGVTVDEGAVEWKRLELVPEEPDEPPPPPDEGLEEGDVDLTAGAVAAAPAATEPAADAAEPEEK